MIRVIYDGPVTYNELTWEKPEAEGGVVTFKDLTGKLGEGTVYAVDAEDSYGVAHLDEMVYGEKIAPQTKLATLDGRAFRFVAGREQKTDLKEPAQP